MAISLMYVLRQCFRIMMLLISCSMLHADGGCTFPDRWVGHWFQSGSSSSVQISPLSISTKGECVDSFVGDKFLVHDKNESCHRCIVIHENHYNVLQYKETYCSNQDDKLRSLCSEITGDAQLFLMFRVSSMPEPCPFKGPFTFTYSRGFKECKNPLSNIDTCTDDWRMLLRFQACPDVPGTESTVEELACLAHWKDGSTRYLVGKLLLEHKMSTSDEDKYRCFVYEKNTEHDHGGFKLAQSGDATCNGLFSPTEGSRTMKLNKTHYSAKCHFPSWLVHSQQWHTLNGRKNYTFSHKNRTVTITNSSSSFDAVESKIICLEEVSNRDKTGIYITQMTTGCKIGYVCLVFHKRGHYVVELQRGRFAPNLEEACNPPYFERTSSEFVTLITPIPKSKQCPYLGKYNLLNAKWQFRHEREICQGLSTLRVGCDRIDTIEFETDCPSEQKIETYECHANWHENGTNYLITSIKGTKHRYCFVYTENEKILQFSSLQETCKRNIQPGIAGIMAFNVTIIGHCSEMPDRTTSNHSIDLWMHFFGLFIILALIR